MPYKHMTLKSGGKSPAQLNREITEVLSSKRRKIPTDRAAAIIHNIIADLTDRRGLRQEWGGLDPGIRREIVESWETIVKDQIA